MRTIEWALESPEQMMNFVEGCLNDFEGGISTKEETMKLIADLILECVKKTALNKV